MRLDSENLRHRYNAAEAVLWYIGNDPKKTWGIDLLLNHVADGDYDGSGVTSVTSNLLTPVSENFPDGDEPDIMDAPLDDVCWRMGHLKCEKAVPTLIDVLKRKPDTKGAAFALGEIGDPQAIPILI